MMKRHFPVQRVLFSLAIVLFVGGLVSCEAQTTTNPTANNPTANSASGSAETSGDPISLMGSDYDWPRLLGTTFDGSGNIGDLRLDWSTPPTEVWRLEVGEGYGLGSVADGRYFHFDAIVDGGQRVERLTAYDLANGSPLWSQQRPLDYRDLYGYERGPRGTPAVKNDKIVTLGVAGDLCVRRVDDGSLLWSVNTNKEYGVVQNFFGVGSSPLILDDRVIVQVGGSPPEDQQIAPGRLDRVIPNGSAVVAFDLNRGDEVWRCGDDLASYSSPRPMELDGETVVLMFARNHLLAIDPNSGEVIWKVRHRADILESVNAMIPVVQDDLILISECYQNGSVLLRAGESDAEVVWQDPSRDRRSQAMRSHWSTPVLIDGYLYGCSGRNNPDSSFRCVEFKTGEVKWSDDRRIRTSVTRAGDRLIVWDERGRMQIVDPNPEALKVIAEFDFRDDLARPCWAAPILVGNQMLIRGDRKVLCLAIETKTP
jgi:outer membrane protein assembly factor BamB